MGNYNVFDFLLKDHHLIALVTLTKVSRRE